MNPALRVLGAVAVLLGIAGATYGAFATIDTQAEFASIGISEPDQTPLTLVSGGSTTLSLTVENLGDASEDVILATETPGFSYETSPVQLDPGQSDTVNGQLSAELGNHGERTVHVHAERAETQQRLGSVSFPVEVIESQNVNLTFTPDLPAAIPGEELTLSGTATNPMGTAQEVQFTLSGIDGTVEPNQTQVAAESSTTTVVTAEIPSDASGTLTATLTAENQAGQSTTATAEIPVLDDGEIEVGAVYDELHITAASEYAVPVLVVSTLDEGYNVTASGEHVVRSEFGTVAPSSALGGFATVGVPEDATDAFETTIDVHVGDQARSVDILVDPTPQGQQAEAGQQVTVDYVGRLADGSVFDASIPEVAYGPFPKSDQFQERPGLEPLEIPLNPQRPGVVQGFYDALVEMEEGESKTARLSPTEAYGPPRTHENITATTELNRQDETPRFYEEFPIQRLPPEFEIEDKEEGDVITYTADFDEASVTYRFELIRKGSDSVDLERLVDIGETTTLYPMWPNASKIVDVTDENIVIETTPPEDTGNFTWDMDPRSHHAQWENATRVESVTEDQIVLRHTPEEGSTYTIMNQRQGPQEYLVESVTGDSVHVSTPNGHPLAGLSLTFDITMHEVSQPAQQGTPTIGGGSP